MLSIEQLPEAGIRFVNKKSEPDIIDIKQQYNRIMAGFSDKNRPIKESKINGAFRFVSERLVRQDGFVFGERQEEILKLKLARHLLKTPKDETIDHNTLFDAILESPKFLNDDKGSFHHLLKVHKQKTQLKIVEMRKNRTETAVNEGLNPYEALFTTKSGNFYLARLLNMPHLQEESKYMNNCVGTNDSYLDRIKKGETEIFSLRKIEGDTPLVTIEYSVKTGIIEQIKKKDNQFLGPNDPLLEDAIDALKQLRDTKNDLGKSREINKINPNELQNIRVKPEHFLTDQGEIHFTNLHPEENPFIFKTGVMLLTDITCTEAAKLLQIFERLEFNPDQIALQQNEINKNTKAYVGKLEPGIFDKILRYNIENIYTSFPEGRVVIEKDLKIEPITFENFDRKIKRHNKSVMDKSQKIEISRHAEYMMRSKDFATLKDTKQMSFVRLKVRDLGDEDYFTRYEDIWRSADQLGLKLCPPETAPYMRFHFINQPLGEIRIGTKELDDGSGDQRVFDMGRNEIEMWFGAGNTRNKLHPNAEFVFRLPELKTKEIQQF